MAVFLPCRSLLVVWESQFVLVSVVASCSTSNLLCLELFSGVVILSALPNNRLYSIDLDAAVIRRVPRFSRMSLF